MFWTYLSAGLAILSSYAVYKYWQLVRMRSYWKNKGFPNIDASEAGGDLIWNLAKGVQIQDQDKNFYKVMKDRNLGFAGTLEHKVPVLMIKDLDMLRNVFVKDFDYFLDHREFEGFDKESKKLLSKMLIFMEGDGWKGLRTKMSPTFTTGKIRRMFEIFRKSSQNLVEFIDGELKTSPTVNLVDAYGKYTLDVISSAAFGMDIGVFREKKSLFEKMAEKLQFKFNFISIIIFLTLFFAPRIGRLLKFRIFNKEACDFYSATISSTISHRKKTGEKRNDFLQLMLEAAEGQLKIDESELSVFEKEATLDGRKLRSKQVALTEDVICAQCILFFLAGFDTVQSLLQSATYQLAVSQDVQETLTEEVIESYRENGDKFTYESINELEFMDKFISETLRMCPPLPRLDRKCTTAYKVPGTELIVPAGTDIVIPIYSIHHDEDIYPDPERFDADRFTKEAKAQRSPYAYMPFGRGPRNCIGMRFALTEAKLAIAHLVENFHLEPSANTPIPIKFANAPSLKPAGVMLNLRRRQPF